MHVLVLIAGVVDPKWPLVLDSAVDTIVPVDAPRRLSPFDESALEIALALRDRDAATRIDVVVCGGAATEALVRTAASYRVDGACRLECPPAWLWDARRLSIALMPIIDAPGAMPDLVLLGREFGDCDDGLFAPFLAEAWGWRYAGIVQRVLVEDGAWVCTRMRGNCEEQLHCPAPVLASVTNDRSNRLRHPLMKNVVAAKRMEIEVLNARDAGDSSRPVRVMAAALTESRPRSASGHRRLDGRDAGHIDELARFLAPWRQ